MTASTGGILRSRSRYSSASNGGVKSDAAISDAAAPTPTRIAGNESGATEKLGGATPKIPSHKAAINDIKKKTRSLADLVKCSAGLSAEASGITDSERGNVASHKSSDSPKDVKFTEGESLSTLHISDEGTPYMRASGPEVVDANNDVMAIGVMGEDGQQVRFCEFDDGKTGEIDNGDTSTSKDRLDQKIDIDCDDDFDMDEEEKNGNDSDNSSNGSNQDEEIWAELGLSELISDEEDEITNVEKSVQTDLAELRSFRVLWELLTRWTTPSTIELVLHYQGKEHKQPAVESPQSRPEEEKSSTESCTRNEVDIGASRMASIMTMLKMNITRSTSELKKMHKLKTHDGIEVIDQRKVEQRLADLVRTFDSAAPAANLNMKMWKGLTTILIAISFPPLSTSLATDDTMVPPSIRPLKMSAEEYRYLTQSAIVSLSSTA
mmetsp:Transcript_8426/g.15334  ORF Transcript_8426/g.15334 Transcript_8426/m.15334 type:complete len:436 (-) Transcript_8426:28-1335(-)|eukprot:CAMPEP_0201912088 /NCGR_PEP_ID=MMETSP0903-20130614/2856_1 /ASSEMBLY_ACC=CAM_ASM_000552 /TAXON_ID=420261 /ORGANISM="Thalassiosira antarctica, Strain CCMP982" /LENGTH=435 /DNA_ID=CAMNT_0048446973 /DNA_START=42 /DNA_END=1349 /DNA_ORIENTATION=+